MIRARVRAAALAAPILCAIALALSPARAAAHRLAPALLSIDEQPDGAIAVSFKMPSQQPVGAEIEPELPESCAPIERPRVEIDAQSITVRWAARCGDAGIVGMRFGVRGLGEAGTNALLRVALRDGRREQAVLHAGVSSLVIPERTSALTAFADYLRLGVLHIATGFDHLLFVFGLVLLARGTRRLLWTVTAFTAGHSVTLSLAALGVVRFPTAPIEVAIALTILVLALELARGTEGSNRESRLRRRPWAVAFAFGLLHGFGFAGALAAVGLPQEEIPVALFSFNVGIELGQVGFVLLVLATRRALAPALASSPEWLARAPITAMGGLSVYWCLDRVAKLL